MAQKIVTFEVAKALKEAGYPQKGTPYQYVSKDYSTFKEGEVIDSFFSVHAGDNVIDIPTYLDAWLWLWREKKIAIGCPYENTYNYWFTNINAENDKSLILWKYSSGEKDDPEEAIAKAIEYLVINNLIK